MHVNHSNCMHKNYYVNVHLTLEPTSLLKTSQKFSTNIGLESGRPLRRILSLTSQRWGELTIWKKLYRGMPRRWLSTHCQLTNRIQSSCHVLLESSHTLHTLSPVVCVNSGYDWRPTHTTLPYGQSWNTHTHTHTNLSLSTSHMYDIQPIKILSL